MECGPQVITKLTCSPTIVYNILTMQMKSFNTIPLNSSNESELHRFRQYSTFIIIFSALDVTWLHNLFLGQLANAVTIN